MQLHILPLQRIKILFLILIILFFPQITFAQNNTSRILELAPFLTELKVDKGQSTSSNISVTNRSNQEITIAASSKDFLPGLDGQPQFVPDIEENGSTFSLASWIKFLTPNKFTIKPNETFILKYAVSPPKDAEQGTHYGAILFSYSSGDLPSGVEVTQSVGTIILLGYGQSRTGGASSVKTSKSIIWWNDKIEFSNKFDNIGNVHVKPKGEVYIKNMFGKIVATDFYNKDASNVLPKSDRTFIAKWFPSVLSFGRYKAESILVFGVEKLETRQSNVVWVLPLYLVVPLLFLIILMLWFLLHGRHWHRRRVLKRHQDLLIKKAD